MNHADGTVVVTAGGLLFPQAPANPVSALITWLSDSGLAHSVLTGVSRLGGGAYQAVNELVGNAVKDLMNVNVGDVVLGGWSTYRDVKAAAARTLKPPRTPEVVTLEKSHVKRSLERKVDILLDKNPRPLATLDVELVMDLVLEIGVLTVSEGALVAVQACQCTADVALSLKPVNLFQRKASMVMLPGRQLNPPIVVQLPIPQPAQPPAEPPTRPTWWAPQPPPTSPEAPPRQWWK